MSPKTLPANLLHWGYTAKALPYLDIHIYLPRLCLIKIWEADVLRLRDEVHFATFSSMTHVSFACMVASWAPHFG